MIKIESAFIFMFLFITKNIFNQNTEITTFNNRYYYQEQILFNCQDSTAYSGEFIEFYPGKTKCIGNYENGIKNGLFKHYDSDITLIDIENYQNG